MILLLLSAAWAQAPLVRSTSPSPAALAERPVQRSRGQCAFALPGGGFQADLVTTSPGPHLFTAFGHTALRLSGGDLPGTLVLDWGTYQPPPDGTPVAAFLDGTLDYTLEAVDPARMVGRARQGDRSIVVQRLDLPPDVLLEVVDTALAELSAEDRRFRYHWLVDNCSTRVRDLLDDATGGQLRAQLGAPEQSTARREVLRHLGAPVRGPEGWPLWFGWHFMTSDFVDRPLDAWALTFLPDRFMHAARELELTWPDGSTRPLVAEECEVRRGGFDFVPLEPPRRDGPLFAVGIAWAALCAAPVRVLRHTATALLGLIAGLLGSLTMVLAATSHLEGFTHNEAWWVAGPGHLLLLGVFTRARGRLVGLAAVLAALALFGLGRVLLGATEQDVLGSYALFLPPLLATALMLWRSP